MEYKCAVIDLDSVCFTIAHPNKVLDENNKPLRKDNKYVYEEKTIEEMYSVADNLMDTILNQSGATHYIAYIKGKGNYRYTINPDYKSNRPKESPWWWKDVKQHLITNHGAIEVNNIEVDDAVNITVLNLENSFRCAIDNDLLYLKGMNYNWRYNKWITIDENEASYKFWYDMIKGQSGDSIKGIEGFGPVAATNVLKDETIKSFKHAVLSAYCYKYGEYKGIQEFTKNYVSLFILEQYEGFVIPEMIKFSKVVEELF